MKKRCGAATVICSMLLNLPSSAHEFWIEPESDTTAQVRVGQMLVGENLPYLDRIIRLARHFGPNGEVVLKGRQGDIPALTVDLQAPGLHLLTVETQPAYIVFDNLPEFSDYLAYEGLQDVVVQHEARGLPTTEIAEEYLRYAKSLVQVGPANPENTDRPVGLRYELVADTSPFDTPNHMVTLKLLWEGSPESGAQVAMFHKGTTEVANVTRDLLTTNDAGTVTANVAEPGIYVFSAVHMLQAAGPGSVVWQSHWASLSFTIGGVERSN
jgi:uncharacterized GH25 family protein